MYRNWYEEQCSKYDNIKFYNATEGGVIIKTMENITLDEIINKYNDIIIDIDKTDKDLENKNNILIKVKEYLIKTNIEIDNISPYVDKAIELCNKINEDINRHRKVDKLLDELGSFDIKILNTTKTNSLLGITMQKTIKMITEGFDFEDDKYHKSIINSYKLYEAMKESIHFNKYIIQRALIKINNELE